MAPFMLAVKACGDRRRATCIVYGGCIMCEYWVS